MLIALCGIDGVGKTTHAKMLVDSFRINGYKALYMKQHTNEYYQSDDLKKLLYEGNKQENFLRRIAYFSAADRIKQLEKNIIPKLENGYIVVVDRYVFSSYAYFETRGVELNWLKSINQVIKLPDITICLDLSINEVRKRINRRKITTIEEKSDKFLKQVRFNFLHQNWGKTENYWIIDSSKEPEKVNDSIHDIINNNTSYRIY